MEDTEQVTYDLRRTEAVKLFTEISGDLGTENARKLFEEVVVLSKIQDLNGRSN